MAIEEHGGVLNEALFNARHALGDVHGKELEMRKSGLCSKGRFGLR